MALRLEDKKALVKEVNAVAGDSVRPLRLNTEVCRCPK